MPDVEDSQNIVKKFSDHEASMDKYYWDGIINFMENKIKGVWRRWRKLKRKLIPRKNQESFKEWSLSDKDKFRRYCNK